MPVSLRRKGRNLRLTLGSLVVCCSLVTLATQAAQVDIHGSQYSVAFGTTVTTLPNGNVVVSDPDYGPGGRKLGAVYLYSPTGALISALRGNSTDDHVGSYGIKVLASGNFVVLSPSWSNGKSVAAGAATWIDGDAGLSGAVSASNSLVGMQTNDNVGNGGVTLLKNGNYVVSSYSWSNGAATGAGAVTWVDGNTGLSGVISSDNSLVGTEANEAVGAWLVKALANGNYVVPDPNWQSAAGRFGAVMLADGNIGATGTFSKNNSLTGAIAGDSVGSGGIVALSNGNYVVSSPTWNNGDVQLAGAVTWVDGTAGLIDRVSAANSLVGTSFLDLVGSGYDLRPIVALSNGNYVVASPFWTNGAIRNVGAATWGDGSKGISGAVSASNSLVGSVELDYVGIDRVAALSNGNYVVGSRNWHNGSVAMAGAVTWADGTTGLSGPVSASNSLVGSSVFDWVGSQGIRALSNGNYVVTSPRWSNGPLSGVGAITWANGSTGLTGAVSAGNSLVGSTAGDGVGAANVSILANGNYVVDSPFWNNGAATQAGAVTWSDGTAGLIGAVSASNSLVGTSAHDWIGYNFAFALNNGNYVVASPFWSNGALASVGAVTWGNGRSGICGAISAANSLIGTSAGDSVGSGYEHDNGFATYSNGMYVVGSPHFRNGSTVDAGAVSLIRGTGGTVGTVSPGNSVIGTAAGGGPSMVFDYDPTHDTLVVGQPASNVVSLFKADLLFANGFQ